MATLLTARTLLRLLGSRILRHNAVTYAKGSSSSQFAVAGGRLLSSKHRLRRSGPSRSEKIKAAKARIEERVLLGIAGMIWKNAPKSVDGRTPLARTLDEMGGRKEIFTASLIAAPCVVISTLWTWARWYELEKHDKLDCKEQDEGWSKLLGISTPPPPLSWGKMVLNFTAVPALLLQGMELERDKLLGIISTPSPPLSWEKMVQNCTIVPALLLNAIVGCQSTRYVQSPYVLITHAFSHIDTTHLAANMLGLYLCSINIPLPSRLGALKFVSLFLGSAVVGSLTQIALSIKCFNETRDPSYLTCQMLGASGGISGLVVASILWRPKSVLVVPGFLFDGIPTWLYLAGTMGYDIFGLAMQMSMAERGQGTRTAHGAHLGGAAVGAAAFAFWRKTLLKF